MASEAGADQEGELRRLAQMWTATLRQTSVNTARSREQAALRFTEGLEGDVDVDEVVDCFNSTGDFASASRVHHVSAGRSFLRFAQTQGLIETGPIDLLVRPKVTVTSFNRCLDVDEVRALAAAARGCCRGTSRPSSSWSASVSGAPTRPGRPDGICPWTRRAVSDCGSSTGGRRIGS